MAEAGEEEMKVLGVWPSPFAMAVRITLNAKGLSYVYVEEDLFNKSELLLASNPVHKKVPVLIHHGKPLSESQVILQYIDEVWPSTGPPVLPRDPYERAVARFWAVYISDKVDAAWKGVASARTDEERGEAVQRLVLVLETLEGAFKECSKGKAFFAGDGIGYVDAVLGGFLSWFAAFDEMVGGGGGATIIDAARTPLLAASAERFRADDAARDVLPDTGKVLEYLRALQARFGLLRHEG